MTYPELVNQHEARYFYYLREIVSKFNNGS